MKPIIVVTMDVADDLAVHLNAPYSQSIIEAGGIPLLLPLGVESDVKQIMALADGLLLTGGNDVHPFYFGAEPLPNLGKIHPARDALEIALIKEAISQQRPMLAICRGHQLLNVALGGTLFQDINSEHHSGRLLQHSQLAARNVATHHVTIAPNNLLRDIIGEEEIAVNSLHHQAIHAMADTLNVVAKSQDGMIEGIVHVNLPFCLGVQWHPEELAVAGDGYAQKIFTAFIEACQKQG